jgi:hypothetical protein
VAGRRLTTDGSGRAALTVPAGTAARTLEATATHGAYTPATATVTVTS